MSKICSNFAVENEFLACQNRVTNSHKILILNKIIADLQQVMKITSTVGLSGFESWLSNKRNKEETLRVSFLLIFLFCQYCLVYIFHLVANCDTNLRLIGFERLVLPFCRQRWEERL